MLDFKAKIHQIQFRQRSPDPIAGLKRAYF